MEVREGYKQTEVGVIPESWGLKSYDNAFSFLSTATYSRSQLTKHDDVQYLHYGDIHTKYHFTLDMSKNNLPTIPDELAKKYTVLKDGDVVMADASEDYDGICKSVEVKNVGGQKAIAGLHTFLLRDHNATFANGFKGYFASSSILKRQFDQYATGMKVYGVSKLNLKKILIPVPPKEEQQAIAKALSDVDALIASLEQLITKKQLIKQGAMHELLTGKRRLPGFEVKRGYKQTEIGEIPEDWIATTFENVLDGFSSGMTPYRGNPEYYTGEIRWITSGELNYNVIYDTIEKITAEAVKKTSLKILPIGTFLMAITGLEAAGTRGSCGIVGAEATTNQSCMAIYPTEKLSTEYLYQFYVKFGDYLAFNYCQGTKQQSYTAKIVKKLPIILPPTVVEQEAIISVLFDMDTELEALETKLEKTKQLKEGMMHELLTGRIRLI